MNYVSSEIEGDLTVAATYTVIGYFLPLHIGRMRRLYLSAATQEATRRQLQGRLRRHWSRRAPATPNAT
ncbi:hypothetical protein ACC713_20350 [Rhizobium johnstonii]|uniref:hypothetical protein n=1 Tax=Rhizobium johnstonii TaxID=3019933 RepID=UPI003F9BF830